MAPKTKPAPTTTAKTFNFRKKAYLLPTIAATELAHLQPEELMLKLKASNAHLPHPFAKVEFLRTAFFALFRRDGGSADAARCKEANKEVRRSWSASGEMSNLVKWNGRLEAYEAGVDAAQCNGADQEVRSPG